MMKIFFEEYSYDITILSKFLSERYYLPVNNQMGKIRYVGYYFDYHVGESVMILPKVFLKKSNSITKAFGLFTPEELLIKESKEIAISLKQAKKTDFIFSISTWLYLAIKQYQKRNQNNEITESSKLNSIVSSVGERDITELEIIRSLIQFNKENYQLFTFIHKYNSSQIHKAHWGKTINQKNAIFQDDNFLYLETISKQKHINYDEELLVIYVSVLKYINGKYGLNIPVNPFFKPLVGKAFEQLLTKGATRLKQIKNKYFTDKLRKLWSLVYSFFVHEERVRTQKAFNEILLINDFNLVFEDMIDVLLSDTDLKHLKKHKDGKELDHIYAYQDLLTKNDKIYHIGDSKYYKEDTQMGNIAINKQYTYAKNVIQYNIDIINNNNLGEVYPIRYRDDLTEGYNITPNFFISAFVEDSFDFQEDKLEFQQSFKPNSHFSNRLFDRDTLHIQTYNINFLYVMYSYISNNQSNIAKFRDNSRQKFRYKVIEYLNEHYHFYEVRPFVKIDSFIEQHFKKLIGKIYRPSGFENKLLLALERKSIDKDNILTSIGNHAEIVDYELVVYEGFF